MSILDRLLHRIPWNGDKIILHHSASDTTEHVVQMEYGNVHIGQGYIRGDLPQWNHRLRCWEYWYDL